MSRIYELQRQPSQIGSLPFTTIRIEAGEMLIEKNGDRSIITGEPVPGKGSVGTGFYYSVPVHDGFCRCVVTNKHVIEGFDNIWFYVHGTNKEGEVERGRHGRTGQFAMHMRAIPHPDPNVDLCVIPMQDSDIPEHIIDEQRKMLLENRVPENIVRLPNYPYSVTINPEYVPSYQELSDFLPVEDVLMIGYPSALWDSRNNQPIIRRGITATDPSLPYEGKSEFVIDMACFGGSSGSPVFIYNPNGYSDRKGWHEGPRLKLLGILYGGQEKTIEGDVHVVHSTLPVQKRLLALSRIPINLGMVISSQRLRDFEPILTKLFDLSQAQRKTNQPFLHDDMTIDGVKYHHASPDFVGRGFYTRTVATGASWQPGSQK